MTTPQPGIFREGSRFHHILEYDVPEALSASEAKRNLKAALNLLPEFQSETAGVISFGRALWQRLAPDHMPAGLIDFPSIEGWNGTASPSTQRDLLVWLHGPEHDGVFDA
ncbi:MAG: Dyp-type peroxidase, partial [Rhodospirillales bacterium]|nr:Dyp-type peroxidase [Rhodospirillales bacterium]